MGSSYDHQYAPPGLLSQVYKCENNPNYILGTTRPNMYAESRQGSAAGEPAIEDEIEVTPAMIAAGQDAVFQITEKSAARLYRAMEFVRRTSVGQKFSFEPGLEVGDDFAMKLG